MSNNYKIFLCTLALLGIISQTQAMDDNSQNFSPSKTVKKVNETADIEMTKDWPAGLCARFKAEIVHGVKTISLKGINFNSDMMTHLVDSLVNSHKQVPAATIPDTPITFLNFITAPKTTTIEHLIFDRCTVENLQTLYYMKETLAPYLRGFAFPRGCALFLGLVPHTV